MSAASPPTPPLLTTKAAAAYCGFKHANSILRAYAKGLIQPAGNRGGTRALMWRVADLDAFLTMKETG